MAGGTSSDEEGHVEYHTPSSSAPAPPSNLRTEYYSARIEGVRESMLKVGCGVEFQIQSSKDHWTSMDDDPITEEEEYSVESDRQYFEKLKQDHHCQSKHFFKEHEDLVVGEKIGEGGQADIYVAGFKEATHASAIRYDYVVKVLKGDIPLKLLHSQWPSGLFSFSEKLNSSSNDRLLRFEFCGPFGGTLLKDKRPELNNKFAFVMQRYKNGDLRTLIDKRMLHNAGPPFTFRQMVPIMYDIAGDMMVMHAHNILHRDMKASNVFIYNSSKDVSLDKDAVMRVQIADFESSVGVLGTGFWRAPEILLQLKNRVFSGNVKYTPAADVYSYGMLCYEIVTGRIPFEGHSVRDYDLVLSGNTLDLPSDLHPVIKNIIESCWHRDPLQRPSFSHIFFKQLMPLKSFF